MSNPRKTLNPEQKIPQTDAWQGLRIGQDLIITGDPLDPIGVDNKTLTRRPGFLAPTAGQPGIKGDHPNFIGEPNPDHEFIRRNPK